MIRKENITSSNENFRNDINCLRALAVLSVFIFHLGFLPNGYLGVDIFFVISGYLISQSLVKSTENNNFSLINFYERRIRRIVPLVLFISIISLVLGILFMLPNDLEFLTRSVIASIFSFNNVLLLLESSDYWNVLSDYKPLMHTWSLGVEEQFYFLYPLLFLIHSKRWINYKTSIIFLSIVSILFFILGENDSNKFYLFHYRFFEIAFGGICVIISNRINLKEKLNSLLYISLLFVMIIIFFSKLKFEFNVILIVLLTSIIMILGEKKQSTVLFNNPLINLIGKLSFSIYMWHQLILAFYRYSFAEVITPFSSLFLIGLTFALSILTYYLIENPFRKKSFVSFKKIISILSIIIIFITVSSFYILRKGGVLKAFPEIGLNPSNIPENELFYNSDIATLDYNERINLNFQKQFLKGNKHKILIIGDSFARDVANIFLESSYAKGIDISYSSSLIYFNKYNKSLLTDCETLIISKSNLIDKFYLKEIEKKFNISLKNKKIWIFGTKDFGYSNGIAYNKLRNGYNYNQITTKLEDGVLNINNKSAKIWGSNYVDLITPLINSKKEILVFTPNKMFISYDTRHLTKEGARFYASILDFKLNQITKK